MTRRALPVLVKGIRVQYSDRDIKTRSAIIYTRSGNILTVINALNKRTRVVVDRVIGYWPPRVKASTSNFIRVKNL